MNFGNVNGLGIGPGAGLTTVAAAGGVIYGTPYLLNPAFTDFASTTGTLSVYASSVFAHPAVLHLDDSAASAGPYRPFPSPPVRLHKSRPQPTTALR